ncbi:MAG: histone deacetylase family protein, partial [Phycisphaerales bacterium JB038]
MTTTLVYDSICLTHDTGPGHPERPDRIRSMMQALRREELLSRCELIKPWRVDDKLMKSVFQTHDRDYVGRLQDACEGGKEFIDVPDSAVCEESYMAALVSAASSLAGVESVVKGEARNSMCLMRPPGHHCEYDQSMGFCLLNNIAIAAEWLLKSRHAGRVAIIDFDVHHG